MTALEKLRAVEIEIQLKKEALHDTMVSNEVVQKDIHSLHHKIEFGADLLQKCRSDLEGLKHREIVRHSFQKANHLTERPKTKTAMNFPIDQLTETVAEATERVAEATKERDQVQNVLGRMMEYHHKLEKSLATQLEVNDRLAEDLKKSRQLVGRAAENARREQALVRKKDRELAGTQDRLQKLERSAREAERQSKVVQRRKDMFDKELQLLQKGRNETREHIASTLSATAEREAAVERLRKENAAMVQWLLDDANVRLSEHNQFDVVDDAGREELIAALEKNAEARKLATRRSQSLDHTRDVKQRELFDKLDRALNKARASVTAA